MIRQILKRIAIKNRDYAPAFRALSSSVGKINLKVKINQSNESLELHDTEVDSAREKQKEVLEFPFVFLRDNCQCHHCYHAQSSSRTINWEHFDVSIKPKEFQLDNDRQALKIIWDDNEQHTSLYDYEWLRARDFSRKSRERFLKTIYKPEKKLWSKIGFKDALRFFDFKKIIESDHELHDWLKSLATHGVTIIENTPQTEKEARKIADRVGFIRRTHYGEEFMVQAKEGTTNVAYLSAPLQMHTDLPYYHFAPGVNLLHCLVQSKSSGAQNLLSDAFYVAHLMKKNFPEEFNSLSTVLVNWTDVGEDTGPPFHSIHRAPMICLDYDKQIERINHSIPQRDSFFTVPLSEVKGWYKALAKFVELIHLEAVEFKTEEGTILCFDNSRLVHGRKKYEDVTGKNVRHVVGAYLDWDEIYSRLRVLQENLHRF